jgi:hypothetical protein
LPLGFVLEAPRPQFVKIAENILKAEAVLSVSAREFCNLFHQSPNIHGPR